MKTPLIYLAAPYSFNGPSSKKVIRQRVIEIDSYAAWLFKDGLFVYSPISHTHPIKEISDDLPGGWEFWETYGRRMISHCDVLHVLMLENWMNSVGVNAEVKIAEELGIPVKYINSLTYEII